MRGDHHSTTHHKYVGVVGHCGSVWGYRQSTDLGTAPRPVSIAVPLSNQILYEDLISSHVTPYINTIWGIRVFVAEYFYINIKVSASKRTDIEWECRDLDIPFVPGMGTQKCTIYWGVAEQVNDQKPKKLNVCWESSNLLLAQAHLCTGPAPPRIPRNCQTDWPRGGRGCLLIREFSLNYKTN